MVGGGSGSDEERLEMDGVGFNSKIVQLCQYQLLASKSNFKFVTLLNFKCLFSIVRNSMVINLFIMSVCALN